MSILEDRKDKEYAPFDKKYIENDTSPTAEPSAESLGEVELTGVEKALEDSIYGRTWQEITERAIYAPTRFEYFVGLALQGLVTGRAERDLKTAVRKALDLAYEVEALLDKAKD